MLRVLRLLFGKEPKAREFLRIPVGLKNFKIWESIAKKRSHKNMAGRRTNPLTWQILQARPMRYLPALKAEAVVSPGQRPGSWSPSIAVRPEGAQAPSALSGRIMIGGRNTRGVAPGWHPSRPWRAYKAMHSRGGTLRSVIYMYEIDSKSDSYLLEVLCPSLRRRSCNLRRKTDGVLGLNATRYHRGWLRSLASQASVVGSAFGWRATFSRMAA
jgi:hypothetical protein